jgi:hypothetical protein
MVTYLVTYDARRFKIDLIEVHNEMIKQVVPADQLLVMDLQEGWQPLCRFLDKPVPREPFPRLNDSEEAGKVATGIFVRCLVVWILFIGSAVIGARTTAQFLRN